MNIKAYRKIGILIVIILVVSQFIQPTKNISEEIISENDISKAYALPDDVHKIFVNKCYDCHSNNTHYPWYFNVQPIGWWLAAHVHDGKEELDFSEFKNYPPDRAEHKLEELGEVVEDRSMPIKAYTLFHQQAKITDQDAKVINEWLASLKKVDP